MQAKMLNKSSSVIPHIQEKLWEEEGLQTFHLQCCTISAVFSFLSFRNISEELGGFCSLRKMQPQSGQGYLSSELQLCFSPIFLFRERYVRFHNIKIKSQTRILCDVSVSRSGCNNITSVFWKYRIIGECFLKQM